MEQSHPCGVVVPEESRILESSLHEVEGLGEPEQDDDVDDGEGEHVARDHAEDHGHEGASQFDGSIEKKKKKGKSNHLLINRAEIIIFLMLKLFSKCFALFWKIFFWVSGEMEHFFSAFSAQKQYLLPLFARK